MGFLSHPLAYNQKVPRGKKKDRPEGWEPPAPTPKPDNRAARKRMKQFGSPEPRAPRQPCVRCTKPVPIPTLVCLNCQFSVEAAGKAMAAVIGARDGYYRRTYGISARDYRDLYERQIGQCAICRRPQEDLKAPMVVDHNHGTDEVRGLLCGTCNSGLGMFCDSNLLLLQAIAYLTERGSASTAYQPTPKRIVDSMERRLEIKAWRDGRADAS